MREIDTAERFYVDLHKDEITWMYSQPDPVAGDRIVENIFDLNLLKAAIANNDTFEPGPVFEFIESACKQRVLNANGSSFPEVKAKYLSPAHVPSLGFYTIDHLLEMFTTKHLIDAYCIDEYGEGASYEDLREIGIGYTTTDDNLHDIQVYANMVDYRIDTYIDRRLVMHRDYGNLESFNRNGLANLNFSDLLEIPPCILDDFLYSVSLIWLFDWQVFLRTMISLSSMIPLKSEKPWTTPYTKFAISCMTPRGCRICCKL